jgi:hypothetical protein
MNKSKLKEFISYHWAYIFYFCVFIFYSVFMYQCGARHAKKASVEVKRDTITRVISDIAPRMDTIIPLYTYKYIVKHKRDTIRTFTQVQKTDTITDTIPIPITQKKYSGEGYTTYVSGFNQSLDSINVRERTINNTIIKYKSRRWNIGISAGYGMNAKGLSPFIGVGVTYNIFR